MARKRLLWIIILGLCVVANFVTPFRPKLEEISLKPAILWRIGPLPISNSLLCAWLAMALLVLIARWATRRIVDMPSPHSLQNALEALCEVIQGFLQGFAGALTQAILPIAGAFFLYILTINWLSLMPGIGSIGLWRPVGQERVFVPLLRGATADLNTTAALAICSVLISQAYGVRYRGLSNYIARFLPLGNLFAFFRSLAQRKPRLRLLARGLLELFVGLLEIFEELTKIISFSFRLFGNMFGGEVLLVVIAFLAPYIASIPFIALEMLSGFIQALIFATLSTAFFARAAALHTDESDSDQTEMSPADQPVTV